MIVAGYNEDHSYIFNVKVNDEFEISQNIIEKRFFHFIMFIQSFQLKSNCMYNYLNCHAWNNFRYTFRTILMKFL